MWVGICGEIMWNLDVYWKEFKCSNVCTCAGLRCRVRWIFRHTNCLLTLGRCRETIQREETWQPDASKRDLIPVKCVKGQPKTWGRLRGFEASLGTWTSWTAARCEAWHPILKKRMGCRCEKSPGLNLSNFWLGLCITTFVCGNLTNRFKIRVHTLNQNLVFLFAEPWVLRSWTLDRQCWYC